MPTPIGRGDRLAAEGLPPGSVVVTKCDRANRDMVLQQLVEASAFEAEEYFPVSGVTGEGVEAHRLPQQNDRRARLLPPDQVTDLPEPWLWLNCKQLSQCFVTGALQHCDKNHRMGLARIRCEILVERDSQGNGDWS